MSLPTAYPVWAYLIAQLTILLLPLAMVLGGRSPYAWGLVQYALLIGFEALLHGFGLPVLAAICVGWFIPFVLLGLGHGLRTWYVSRKPSYPPGMPPKAGVP